MASRSPSTSTRRRPSSGPCAKPNLTLAVAVDFLGVTHVQSGGSGKRPQFAAVPSEWTSIPGSDPNCAIGLTEEVVDLTHRPSIGGKNLDEPFVFTPKQSRGGSHPHPAACVPSHREFWTCRQAVPGGVR